jgi:predicted CXXCH cytochrome family protein
LNSGYKLFKPIIRYSLYFSTLIFLASPHLLAGNDGYSENLSLHNYATNVEIQYSDPAAVADEKPSFITKIKRLLGIGRKKSSEEQQIVPIDSLRQIDDTNSTNIPNINNTQIVNESENPFTKMLFVHKPYEKKECYECHELDLKKEITSGISPLCYKCHQEYKSLSGFVHGPVSVGACQACHNPHSSKNEHLLTLPGNETCKFCHDMANSTQKVVHFKAGEALCISCHDAHNAANVHFLITKADSL